MSTLERVDATAAGDRLLDSLAYAGALAGVVSLTAALIAVSVRSGLETPALLWVESVSLLLATAFAPFLLTERLQQRLVAIRFAWPLLATAVMLSAGLALWLGPLLAPVYPVAALFGFVRALSRLRRMTAAEAALLGLGAPMLGLYLFATQLMVPFTHIYATEHALIGVLNADSLHHMAISASIQRFGVPSLGADGLVPVHYHYGSHIWFAALASLGHTSPASSYPIGMALVATPWLLLCFFLASVCSLKNPARASVHLMLAIVALVSLDQLGWRTYYWSESFTFGLAVLLASVPLYLDFIEAPRREPRAEAARLVAMFVMVFIGAAMKISVGFLMGVGFGFLVLRCYAVSVRTLAIGAGFAVLGFVVALSFVSLRGAGLEFSWLDFYRTDPPPLPGLDRWGPVWSLVPPLLYLMMLALRRLRAGRPLERRDRLTAELVAVVTLVAAIPGAMIALPAWDARWFQDTPQWLALPLLVAGVVLPTARLRVLRTGTAIFLLALAAATWSSVDRSGRFVRLVELVVAGAEGRAPRPDTSQTWPRVWASLEQSHTFFRPDVAAKLRQTVGARVTAIVREAHEESPERRLLVYVPPGNRAYWRGDGSFLCVRRALWITALTGFPQLQGVMPSCLELGFYGFGAYFDASNVNVNLPMKGMCGLASERGFDAVLVLRSVSDPRLNQKIECPPDRL